jgi:hypothetical protein
MLTRDELLVLLIEECGEVVQAATKCLRFGYDRNQPSYGVNSDVLAKEVGDLIGVVDALPLDWNAIAERRKAKVAKATRIKDMIANEAAPLMAPRGMLVSSRLKIRRG